MFVAIASAAVERRLDRDYVSSEPIFLESRIASTSSFVHHRYSSRRLKRKETSLELCLTQALPRAESGRRRVPHMADSRTERARKGPKRHMKAHKQEGQGVIGSVPGGFIYVSKRAPPVPNCQGAASPICTTSEQVLDFRDESSALNLGSDLRSSPGQIQMKRTHNICAVRILKQPELRPYPGVEVEQVVAAIATIEPVIKIHDAPIADGCQEFDRLLLQCIVPNRSSERRWPCKYWV